MAELYSLPDGWEWKKLDELTEVNIGKTPSRSKSEYFLGNKIWLSIRDLKSDYISDSNEKITDEAIKTSNMKVIPKGTLLMSFKLTLGKTAFADCDLYTNEAIASLPIKNENVIDKYFLKYSINVIDLEKEVDNAVKGKTLNKEKIKNLDIPLPPFEEQKRIVAKLDNLFAKIDKAIALHQKNIDEADIFMASVLNDVFVELEEKYEKYRLEDLTSLITKGTTPTTNGYKFQDSGINFLKIENIVNGEIDLSTIEMFISEEAHQSQKRSQLEINDVLFSIAGTIGDTAIVKKEHLPMNTNQAIALIRPIEKLNSEFLRRLLSSSISNETTNKQRGGAIKNVSLGDIKELELPLPPLQTQQKVVSYLDEISNKMEKIKNLQKKKMQSLKDLKASILDKAFKGEL